MVDRLKVACFSGHRRLPQDCTELKANLEKAIIPKKISFTLLLNTTYATKRRIR